MKRLKTKISLVALALCALGTGSMAQGVVVTQSTLDVNVVGRMYPGVDGSPFLNKEWAKGTVKLEDGTEYANLYLLYDQIKEELIFSEDKEQGKRFTQPVYEFTIQQLEDGAQAEERTYRSGFPSIDGADKTTFYEVIVEGNVELLKRTTKAIVEERAPGAVYKTKQIKENVKYYVAMPDKLVRLSRSKKQIAEVFGDKSAGLNDYIKQNKLNLKEEADLAQLVGYYNTL